MEPNTYPMWCDANDGGIKRGDRAETGDLEARHKETVGRSGSHVPPNRSPAPSTGSADALAESMDQGVLEDDDLVEESSLDALDAHDPGDPILGFTNIGDEPAQDWAADTGPTQTGRGDEPEVEELPDEPAAVPKPVQRVAKTRSTKAHKK